MTITLKRGDTGIGVRATLSNELGNVGLTGANVLFLFGEHEIKCGIHDAPNGVVNITFSALQTDKPNLYKAEFEVTYGDGRVESYPNDGYEHVHIIDDLGGN